jgi:N-acetylglucosamine kinase-like BadF-type ATPase
MVDTFVLGVDGGKSKTLCLLADSSGRVRGWGRAGSSDKYFVPLPNALDQIALAAGQALTGAGLLPQQVACGVFGLAGADWPEDFDELHAALTSLGLARRVIVKNDAHLALRANVVDGPGIALVAGTNLAAAFRGVDGHEWHSGWFSVEGAGGLQTGRAVFWAVMKACDGRGAETVLTPLVLEASGKTHPLELLRLLSENKLSDDFFASLAPLVFRAYASSGDEVSAQIIRAAGEDISAWAVGLLRRHALLDDPVPVVLCGGLFKAQTPLLFKVVEAEIHAAAPHAVVRIASVEPVVGALYYAYDALSKPFNENLVDAIKASLPSSDFFKTS